MYAVISIEAGKIFGNSVLTHSPKNSEKNRNRKEISQLHKENLSEPLKLTSYLM